MKGTTDHDALGSNRSKLMNMIDSKNAEQDAGGKPAATFPRPALEPPRNTLDKQHSASDPASSVWVSANAGSGKTHVLTQRVVRLLLRGVAPSKILCLTFTKAAAANMAERVFGMLSGWTRLSDDELREKIRKTGAPADTDLALARKLFARTVETPGGLKIQTIHAFCERLLHHFPFEANVPSRFEVADDRREGELLARARREVLGEAATSGGRLGAALARVTDECGAEDFETLIREALSHRAQFRAGGLDGPGVDLRKVLGLAESRTEDGITLEMIEAGLSPARLAEIASFLESGKKTDQDRGHILRGVLQQIQDSERPSLANASWPGSTRPSRPAASSLDARLEAGHDAVEFRRPVTGSLPQAAALAAYLSAFFIDGGEGTATKRLVTADLAKARPDIVEELTAEQERLERLREERKAAAACERTAALVTLVGAILERYEAMKGLRGVLDFADLIERTSVLLERSDAAWVLYKLDAGIDHVLVDEAQDTSEAQWRILDRLTGDFSAGAGHRRSARTFFAVGDEKQSIFSFQGAAPHMFAEMRRHFETRFAKGATPFAHVALTQSFRSVPGVLAAVDRVFALPKHQKGLVADDIWMGHEALKSGLPGLVEIWPAIGAGKTEPPSDWRLPLDYVDETDPPSLVARRVAAKIAELLAEGSLDRVHDAETDRPRRIKAGDIMVLVRTRGPFFEAVIRALKASKVPVAGADRLLLARHIAIMDLVAAGRAALLPDDDLTLAAVLKSPLIGLDDEDLLEIAPARAGSLHDALEASANPRHRRAAERLERWRERVAAGAFAFYARLLGEDGGRRALEGRLGPEACDAIDEFLALALAQDKDVAPSLVSFLAEIEAMDGSIKRDMETGADCVRVMTVHAAKGLEAKIVFLPDTCSTPSARHDPRIFALDHDDFGSTRSEIRNVIDSESLERDAGGKPVATFSHPARGAAGLIVWSPGKQADSSAIAAARERAGQAAEEEYRRLLYVALTRAEERVYIAGFYSVRKPGEVSWSEMIKATLEDLDGMVEVPAFWNAEETILRFVSDGGSFPDAVEAPLGMAAPGASREIPTWLLERAVPEPAPAPLVRPSHAPYSSAPAAAADGAAREAGLLTHELLHYLPSLPPEARRKAARDLVATSACLSETRRRDMIEAVLRVIEMPELSELLGPGSRAEVSFAGSALLPSGTHVAVRGRVDRIAVTEASVLVADFKTGAKPETVPDAYLRQMALYRAALAPLWPQRRVRTLLIWTAGPSLTWLDDHALDDVLAAFEAKQVADISCLGGGTRPLSCRA
jgi:ATP-dependent helicase/nuclease subunit A